MELKKKDQKLLINANANKKRKNENFEEKKLFLFHIPRITQPKNEVLRSKGVHTQTRKCIHPFRVSRICFPPTKMFLFGNIRLLVMNSLLSFVLGSFSCSPVLCLHHFDL